MAGKRMLHANICQSKKLSEISFEAETLYYRMLTQADDDGNFTADPRVVLGLCAPLRKEWNDEKVKVLLEELANSINGDKKPLVQFYQKDGDKLLHITKFEDFQYLRPDRYANVKFPTHPEKLGTSLVNPRYTTGLPSAYQWLPEVKLSKEKLSEDKLINTEVKFSNLAARFRKAFHFKPAKNAKIEEDYKNICATYGEDYVLGKFEEWAEDNQWVAEKKAKFPLAAFYRSLEGTAEEDSILAELTKKDLDKNPEIVVDLATIAAQTETDHKRIMAEDLARRTEEEAAKAIPFAF